MLRHGSETLSTTNLFAFDAWRGHTTMLQEVLPMPQPKLNHKHAEVKRQRFDAPQDTARKTAECHKTCVFTDNYQLVLLVQFGWSFLATPVALG